MPSAEARVHTARANRYLTQLCDHLGNLQHDRGRHGHGRHGGGHGGGHDGPPAVRRVERDGTNARIEFDWGSCDLTASSSELAVQVQADDARALASGQELLARRIETIGRREHLTVTWRSQESS